MSLKHLPFFLMFLWMAIPAEARLGEDIIQLEARYGTPVFVSHEEGDAGSYAEFIFQKRRISVVLLEGESIVEVIDLQSETLWGEEAHRNAVRDASKFVAGVLTTAYQWPEGSVAQVLEGLGKEIRHGDMLAKFEINVRAIEQQNRFVGQLILMDERLHQDEVRDQVGMIAAAAGKRRAQQENAKSAEGF